MDGYATFLDHALDILGIERAHLVLHDFGGPWGCAGRAPDPEGMGDLSPRLRALDRPALVVWGAQDPYISVEQAERQRESFPSAQVHVLADSGHWPMVDLPDRVREVVVPFLRRVVRG